LIPEDSGKRKADRNGESVAPQTVPWRGHTVIPKRKVYYASKAGAALDCKLPLGCVDLMHKRRGCYVLESVLPETSRRRRRRKKKHVVALPQPAN